MHTKAYIKLKIVKTCKRMSVGCYKAFSGLQFEILFILIIGMMTFRENKAPGALPLYPTYQNNLGY